MTHPQTSSTPGATNVQAAPDFLCQLVDISVSFGELDVLHQVNLSITESDRLAVLGDNGSGKSSLMRVIAGNLEPVGGQRRMNVPGGIAYAAQNPVFAPDLNVQQVIDLYHRRFRDLETLIQVISHKLDAAPEPAAQRLLAQLQQVTDIYEATDGYSLGQRLDSALQQLGLAQFDRDHSVSKLSGGQRSRLALACVLCSGTQLLLLDEPTNDLDDAALAWLERAIDKHRGALVLISHDRMFLKRFARSIIEVDSGEISHYGNGYDGYLHAKAQQRVQIREAYASWRAELEHSRSMVEKSATRAAAIPRKQEKAAFGHGNFRMRDSSHGSTSKIRQAKSRIEQLTAAPAAAPAQELEFSLPVLGGSQAEAGTLIRVSKAGRAQAPSLSSGDFEITMGQRWLVTGPNGAGKTSLLRMLAGELAHTTGQIERAPSLRCTWLRQELPALGGQSVLEAFALATDQYVEDAAQPLAKLGLFTPQDFARHPMALSVGQRRRLELAIAVSTKAQVLFLDEPTNHISPALVEQLEEALELFPGTVITVSHDRRWQQKLKERPGLQRLHVRDGHVQLVR